MNTVLPIILPAVGTVVVAVLAYLKVSRGQSGTVGTSDASTIFQQAKELRQELRDEMARKEKESRDEMVALRAELRAFSVRLSKSENAMVHAVRYIDELVEWGQRADGGPLPSPPAALHEYLDLRMWRDSRPDNT